MISKTKIPAVGYIRMSGGQQDKSPEQQREECRKLAKREGCEIIRWYFDSAISGDKTKQRKAFGKVVVIPPT